MATTPIKKLDAGLVAVVKNAEETLKGEEKDERARNLGDLADLPPGHPLLRQMEEAKERHEQRTALVNTQFEQRKLKKAKSLERLSEVKQKQEEEKKEQAQKKVINAAQSFNAKIAQYAKETDAFLKCVQDSETDFKDKPFLRSKVVKLLRLSSGMRRMLDDSVIKPYQVR